VVIAGTLPRFLAAGDQSRFRLDLLNAEAPPGDYTLAFVQEKLGEQSVKVTLAAKDAKTVDATFKP